MKRFDDFTAYHPFLFVFGVVAIIIGAMVLELLFSEGGVMETETTKAVRAYDAEKLERTAEIELAVTAERARCEGIVQKYAQLTRGYDGGGEFNILCGMIAGEIKRGEEA